MKVTDNMKAQISVLSFMLGILVMLASCTHDDGLPYTDDAIERPMTITAALPNSSMASRATLADDDPADNCFLLIVAPDGYEETIAMTPGADGSFTASPLLNPSTTYKLYFWADNAVYDPAGPLPDLRNVKYAPGNIAFAATTDIVWSAQGATVQLKHVVTRLTVKTTTSIKQTSQRGLTIYHPSYQSYNVVTSQPLGTPSETAFMPSPADIVGTKQGAQVGFTYMLMPDNAQLQSVGLRYLDPDFTAETPRRDVDNVPIRPNTHVTLTGDVAHWGTVNTPMTVTVDPTWGSTAAASLDYDYDPATNTYTVKTADGLFAWREAACNDLSTNCILANDINISGRQWTPVQDASNNYASYTGTFDGARHTISGLTIVGNSTYGAFFYGLKNATVKDVTFTDVSVQSRDPAATIALDCDSSLISNCHVTGKLASAQSDAVGLIYQVFNKSTVSDCSFKGEVSGSYNAAGIASYLEDNSTIEGCRVEADITSTYNNAAGIASRLSDNSTIEGCRVEADITATRGSAGGIAYGINCRDASDLSKIIGCSFKGNVKAYYEAAGIVAYGTDNYHAGELVIACHSSGTISGGDVSSGIVGLCTCKISSCYTTAEISGTGTKGAIVGDMLAMSIGGGSFLHNCYYQSNVTETNKGATAVDGSTVTWQSAMDDMNAALKDAGYQWQYKANDIDPTDTDEPLLLLKN